MSTSMRSSVVAWVAGVGAGLAVDLAHSVAWHVWLRRAHGDAAFGVVVALLAVAPIAVTFTASLLLLREASTARGLLVFLVVLATSALQSALLVEPMFPGMLPPVAIGGRALGLMLTPIAFAIATVVARRRRRSD